MSDDATAGQAGRGPARAGAACAFLAAATYSAFLLERWTHPRFPADHAFISQLELPGQPWSWLYRSSDVISGVAMVLAAVVLWRTLRGGTSAGRRVLVGTGSFLVAGLASAADGATAMRCTATASRPCDVSIQAPRALLAQLGDLHADSGVLGLLGAAAAAVLLGSVMVGQAPVLARISIVTGTCIASAGLLDVALLMTGADIGLAERARVLLTSIWLGTVGIWLLLHPHGNRRPAKSSELAAGCLPRSSAARSWPAPAGMGEQ